MTDHDTDRIVIGVDGSQGSKTALRWAMIQAGRTGATVEAITVWQDPARYGTAYGWTSQAFEGDTYINTMAKVLDDTVDEVSAQLDRPVTVVTRILEGHPAEALLRAASGARLLVLGSRGHGAFAGMVLGSITQHCIQHPPCPVVVVP
jgi:nucleotide-binding universal stress UspA family protein